MEKTVLLIGGGALFLLYIFGQWAKGIAADEQGLVLKGAFTPDPSITFTPRRTHGGDMNHINQSVAPPHRGVYIG